MTEGADWRVILGLDGTVLDPSPGLLASLRHALAEMQRPVAPDTDLAWTLDMEFAEAIRQLLGADAAQLESTVAARFRDHYDRAGRFAGQVHPSMARVLTAWTNRPDIETVLVSAHPRTDLEQQLARLDLSRAFDTVACTRDRACAHCRRALTRHVAHKEHGAPAGTLWLSDDPDDLNAAAHHGITSIAALWGRSTAPELAPAQPDLWARTPEDLSTLLWSASAGGAMLRTH